MKNKVQKYIKKENYKKLEELANEYNPKKILKNVGKINNDFDCNFFIKFLENKEGKTRFFAAKNLGKVIKSECLPKIKKYIKKESSSEVRRELYSAIGRLKKEDNIKYLLEGTKNENPKVIMQCIRGLLYHKDKKKVRNRLKKLSNHPNEIIQEVIKRELCSNKKNKIKSKHHSSIDKSIKNKLVIADAKQVLKKIPDRSIHLTFTSPPYYNAKDYSFYNSYEEYLNFITKIIKEIHRVTKEGRYFILNTSPVLIPRFSRKYSSKRYLIPYDLHPRITNIGFDFIEEIIWKKPEASAINRNGGFFQHRKPLAYKANHCTESVIVYRKKTTKLIDWNIKQYNEKRIEKSKIKGNYESSNVWEIPPSRSKYHPATFPEELASRIIKFYSFKNDLVMDPMAGIGTVGKSALNLGRNFFLIDKEESYLKRAYKDLKNSFAQTEIKLVNSKNFNL